LISFFVSYLEGGKANIIRFEYDTVLPEAFALFSFQVKLEDLEMSTREYWKMQIIFARRQRRPASFGFYYPAREGNGEEGLADGKKVIHYSLHGMEFFYGIISCIVLKSYLTNNLR